MKLETYLRWRQNMEHKNIHMLRESIEDLFQKSDKEKKVLLESIEMLWLDASIKRKKKEVSFPEKLDANILRIRQLLAAAWLEDLKE